MEFFGELLGCLTFSRESFKKVGQRPSLRRGLAVVLLAATVAAAASYNYHQLPLAGVSLGSEIAAVLMFIGGFVWWLLSSSLFHGFAKLFKKTGSFAGTLTLTGYASSPMLIQHVLRLVDSLVVGSGSASKLSGTLTLFPDPGINSVANAVVDTFTLFRLWSIGLYIIAVSENYKMSLARSTVVAVGACIILMLLS